ncbi:MAG: LysR family transcriptional regulator [Rubrivivax sp.]
MDTLLNLQAFLQVVKTGSFAETARRSGLAVSVVKKRVDQFEHRAGMALLERSTRKLELNAAGKQHIARLQQAAQDMEDALAGLRQAKTSLAGHLRIKVPTTLNQTYLGNMFNEFLQRHPGLSLELIAIDRTVNPRLEGFDLAIGITPESFGGVMEIGLTEIRRVVVAAPDYLARNGVPQRPSDLLNHAVLSFQPIGDTWVFEGPHGSIDVKLTPSLSCNDAPHIRHAALAGLGVTSLSSYIVQSDIDAGRLVQVLKEYPVPRFWIHMQVPEVRAHLASVRSLIAFLREHFNGGAPWERRPAQPAEGPRGDGGAPEPELTPAAPPPPAPAA